MIQIKNSTTHYINERALTFSENDLNDPMRVAVSLVSGTVIMVYVPGTIDYAADGNYERWTLKGYSTKLVNDAAHYIYARLSRTDRTALVVFSVKDYNIDGSITTITGKDEEGNDITETTDPSASFFYVKIGELTATDGTSSRELTYDSGLLSTKKGDSMVESSSMWELLQGVNPLIKAKYWLTNFVVKGFVTLVGGLIFKNGNIEKPIVDVKRSTDSSNPNDENYVPVSDDTIPTTAWIQSQSEDRYLRKYEEDETQFRIKFFDGVECGEFVAGPLKILGGSGTKFDGDGYGEMNGLRLREFLEVPELRFNRIDVVSGILWNSIAFGLIESVDESRQTCTLKLEEGERCGLHLDDICMGIFSDFGDGTVADVVDPNTGDVLDPGDDDNGLPKIYGFSTSYFTPKKILQNEAGIFEFEYTLQPGTSVHPKPSMKFAVYGNFLDESRQASAYSTRTYKRYLNKVNSWVIDPTRNIYAQYGKLDGLTIGGQEMTGYGSYQHNSYFSGVQIQFTPEQEESLKGKDAYSVSLSDYVGIVRMASDGTIYKGGYIPYNVVSGGENVVTGDSNVVTSDYLLKTRIQAFRGTTELFYSNAVDKDVYVTSINPVGCVAFVDNGVICVSEVTSLEHSYINITVNCEGNASFDLTYQVKLIKDGESPIYADVDNEMDSVSCDENGKVLFGLPVKCTARMYAGSDPIVIENVELEIPKGVKAASELSMDSLSVNIVVSSIEQNSEKILPVGLYLYSTYKGIKHVRKLVFTIAKQIQGKNGVIYKLSPSATAIKKDRNGSENLSVFCGITKHDGLQVSRLSAIPEGYSMSYKTERMTEESVYVYDSEVGVVPDDKTIAFSLYCGDELIDIETIPVLMDGNSAFRSTVFLRSNDKPDTPSPTGSYEYPRPEDVNDKGLLLWSDGVPPGESILWSSSRIFSIDGLFPQEEAWSEPMQMTDTSSFDVEFSSVQVNPGNPTENPGNWSNTAGSDTWWMATRVMKNGEWSAWSVSQIKGEKGEPGEDGSDGDSSFKSTVFIRINETPGVPTGGSYASPKPTSSPTWSDGIPSGEEMLWASTRIFTKSGGSPQQSSWSTPRQMTDTSSFDVEFSSVQNPSPPSGHPNTNTQWSDKADSSTIWMATSSKKNGIWEDWQVSKIKGEDGSDGDSSFKSTVFIRINETLGPPTGGSYASPKPTSYPTWSDGIPSGEETLWASTRIFTKSGGSPQQSSWSTPRRMTDTASFDVEFSSAQNPNPPSGHPNTNTQWSDKADSSTIWMATSSKKNGEWGDWQVSKIKGEAGLDGADAVSYKVLPEALLIGQTVTGSVSPGSTTFTCYKDSGSASRVEAEAKWYAYRRVSADYAWTQFKSQTSTMSSTFSVTFSSSYKEYKIEAYPSDDKKVEVYPRIVKDGANGDVGPTGAIPRYCGTYKTGTDYVYNSQYRDIVVHNGNVFQVYSYGSTVTSTPSISSSGASNDGYWELANKFNFVAMDTALVDSANIAGFTFIRERYDDNGVPVGTMRSQSSNSYVSYSNDGVWLEDGSFRKSPKIENSGFAREIVTFTVTEKCIVLIEMISFSEGSHDIGFVGEVDRSYVTTQTDADGNQIEVLDDAIKTENMLSVSGTESGIARIESEPGTYSVEVIYVKDESTSMEGDCVKYRFVGSPKLWLSSHSGTLSCSDVHLTGTINADSGYIGDWEIIGGTMATEGVYVGGSFTSPFKNTLDVSGMQVSINSDDITARFGAKLVSFSEDGDKHYCSTLDIVNSQISSSRRTDDMCGVHVKGNKNDLGIFIEGAGIYVSPEKGALSKLKGLALSARKVSETTTLSTNDDMVLVDSNATVSLPSAGSCAGKIYVVKILSGTLRVENVYLSDSSSVTSSKSWTDKNLRAFFSVGGYWVELNGV